MTHPVHKERAAPAGPFGAGEVGEIRARLLSYFDARRRDLPWRGEPDPYRVWVSEVMLQQTRVATVIPYYERWLQRFPTLDALAGAGTDDVLRAWQGLGYYSRARNLHAAAKIVRERFAGQLPGDPAALRSLPGVGAYTAGAVASIAFGRAEPAVDGNVARVLARLLDEPAPGPATLQATAAALVDRARPGDFNQALMELGATLCTPRAPRCGQCPVADLCRARRAGTEALRPAPRPRPAPPLFERPTAVIVDDARRVLLLRRPERGLLAGLWTFPADEPRGSERASAAARRVARSLLPQATFPRARRAGSVEHTFSHRREVYELFLFRLPGDGPAASALPVGEPACGATETAWGLLDDLSAFVMPRGQQGIAEAMARVLDGRRGASGAGRLRASSRG
jgi:A/G-specific adenine glycosylase